MPTKRLYLIFFNLLPVSLLLCSCSSTSREQNGRGQNAMEERADDSLLISKEITPNFQALRFWDRYDFTDTLAIQDSNNAEQTLVEFIARLHELTPAQASSAIKSMLDSASVNHRVFEFFTEKYEYYLYHPNSPLRSDLYYEAVLEYLINSSMSTDTDKIRHTMRLESARKNKIGSVATNFNYITSSGRHRQLHTSGENYKMLLFYDPGCSHCEKTISLLNTSASLNQLISDKTLQIIAICPLEDHEQWKQYQSHIPSQWTNGFDTDNAVIHKGLYALRAYPTIYLLNKNNEVVLKDPDWQDVIKFFDEKSEEP